MQNKILNIAGMTCDGCASKVAHALKSVPGVHDVVVTLTDDQAAVRYDETVTSPEKLQAAVTGAGYGVRAIPAAPSHPSKGGCCG